MLSSIFTWASTALNYMFGNDMITVFSNMSLFIALEAPPGGHISLAVASARLPSVEISSF